LLLQDLTERTDKGFIFVFYQSLHVTRPGGYPKLGHDHFHVHSNSLFTPRNYIFEATDSVFKRIVIKYVSNLQEHVHIRTSRLKSTVSLHSNVMDLRERDFCLCLTV